MYDTLLCTIFSLLFLSIASVDGASSVMAKENIHRHRSMMTLLTTILDSQDILFVIRKSVFYLEVFEPSSLDHSGS